MLWENTVSPSPANSADKAKTRNGRPGEREKQDWKEGSNSEQQRQECDGVVVRREPAGELKSFSLTTAETYPSVFKFCSGFVHPHLSGPRSSWFWSLADICLFYLEAKNGNLEPGRSLALMALERKAGRVRGLCGHGLILSDLLLGPGADVYFHGWN